MSQYLYNGVPVTVRRGWVVINDTRMKLTDAQGLEGFESPSPITPPDPTPEEVQEIFVRSVRAEVTRRIGEKASTATQINLAAAAAGGVLTSDQMSAYLAGLSWVNDMRATGTQLILDADADYALDTKWPALPAGVADLLEAF